MRKEQAEQIAAPIIEQLRKGTVPWRKPWSAAGVAPHNYYSTRAYRGINTLILGCSSLANEYKSPAWTTYKAAQQHGAQVRKGEKSTQIVFWKPMVVRDEATGDDKKILIARMYNVFNTDQIDGIDWQMPERDPVDIPVALKQIIADYPDPPSISHAAQDRAYYRPSTDSISLPLVEQFSGAQAYAETACHELVHSTGHPKRCARFDLDSSGHRSDYALEELVAEIGASMLMQQAGIEVDMPQIAAYVQSWLHALENDHSLVVKAAQRAQKAVDHITNHTQKEE
jgi:antirestriction protein ArdC